MPDAPDSWNAIDERIGSGALADGTTNGAPCLGARLAQVANASNHHLAVGRCLFAQGVTDWANDVIDPGGPAPAVATQWRFSVDTRNDPNGKFWRCLILYQPIDHIGGYTGDNQAILYITEEAGPTQYQVYAHNARSETVPAPLWPEELLVADAYIDIGGEVDGTTKDFRIEVDDGFRLFAIAIWECGDNIWPASRVNLSGADQFVNPRIFRAGNPIVSDGAAGTGLVDLRESMDYLFHNVRDQYAWSQPENNPRTTNALAPVNLVDGTGARTSATWGIPISSRLGGYGGNLVVEATCRVYAERVGGVANKGRVRFISSQGFVEVIDITVAGWYPAPAKLDLDVGNNVDGVGRSWDKVDVAAYLDGGPGGESVRVTAVTIDIDPD